MSRKIKSVSFAKVREVADRIALLSIYAAISMPSQPTVSLIEKTLTQINTDSADLSERLDAWENDMTLVRELLSALETVRLISLYAVLSLPSNPSTVLLEKTFNRIHEVCSELVNSLDKVEGLS